jgi:uncharacterized protein YsxB (DUF464 family)
MNIQPSRRQFLCASAAAVAFASVADFSRAQDKKPQLKKAVKFGMIKQGDSIKEKLALIKSLGF